MDSPLGPYFIVACEILTLQSKNEKVTSHVLGKNLAGELSSYTIRKAIRTLLAHNIIQVEYGETDRQRAARFYRIEAGSKLLITELNEKYWKKKDAEPGPAILADTAEASKGSAGS